MTQLNVRRSSGGRGPSASNALEEDSVINFERHPRISARVLVMMLVLLMTPLFGAAGAFKIGRLLSEIRPILSEGQLREVGEMMEEVRVSSEIRFADFAGKLEAGELLGLKSNSTPSAK